MIISGETLRLLRHVAGMKQETIAKKLGISQPAYCRLEKCNQINGGKLDNIAKAMGYTRKELEKIVRDLPQKKMS